MGVKIKEGKPEEAHHPRKTKSEKQHRRSEKREGVKRASDKRVEASQKRPSSKDKTVKDVKIDVIDKRHQDITATRDSKKSSRRRDGSKSSSRQRKESENITHQREGKEKAENGMYMLNY